MSYLDKLEKIIARQIKDEPQEIPKALEESRDEPNKNIPSWYTEEDRKAVAVLQGICKGCTHLLLVKDSSAKDEFMGVWCAALKKKLEAKVDSCSEFYTIEDEIDRLKKQMGIK